MALGGRADGVRMAGRCALGIAVFMAWPLGVFAQVPIPMAASPQWQVLRSAPGQTVEYEAAGVQRRSRWTYVAFRHLHADRQDAYVLSVHAFDCQTKAVATALLGRMALGGLTLKHGPMNTEDVLAKYNERLPIPQYPHLQAAYDAVCLSR